jgi:hypothetical protein
MADSTITALIALSGVFASVGASLFVSLRQSKIEIQKLRDEYLHRYAGRLFEKRLEVYPELLSPFVDVIHKINLKQISSKEVKELFPVLSEWDTKYAVLVGAQPQQTIHRLYLMLADLSQMSDSDLQSMLDDQESLRRIKQRFLELFLSLKNDLGIYSLKSPSAITNTKDPLSFAEVDEMSGIKEQRYMINKVPPSLK